MEVENTVTEATEDVGTTTETGTTHEPERKAQEAENPEAVGTAVHTGVHKITTPTRISPVIRVTALPWAHVCHICTVYYPAPLPCSRVCFSLSLFVTGFPVTPPEPGPAPSPASGFRPSGLPTPVSPGVPTGARNLGVCVFSCFAPNLRHCLSLVVSVSTSLYSLVLRSQCRPEPNLCYSTLVPSHPRSTPSSATAPNFHLPHLLTLHRASFAYHLRNPTDPPRHPFGTSGEGG